MNSSEYEVSGGTGVPGMPDALVGVEWLAREIGLAGEIGEGAGTGGSGGPEAQAGAGQGDLIVLDASVGARRGKGPWIPGARIFDIDGEMSDHDSALPHTMPQTQEFAARIRELGIGSGDRVVVYDAAGIYSSARAWWMLRAMGFAHVAVLDGGLPGWLAAGLPVATEPAQGPYEKKEFTVRPRADAFVGVREVRVALADSRSVVLDARTRGRFAGTEPEPRAGLRSGHMPGSVNLPFGELQDGHGRMRSTEELRSVFGELAPDDAPLVVSCGSGVTACVLALGAEIAGRRGIAVYDGSWGEWGLEATGTPVATGAR